MLSELKSVFLWLVFELSCTSFSNLYNEIIETINVYIEYSLSVHSHFDIIIIDLLLNTT